MKHCGYDKAGGPNIKDGINHEGDIAKSGFSCHAGRAHWPVVTHLCLSGAITVNHS